jgi:hypothetical protein
MRIHALTLVMALSVASCTKPASTEPPIEFSERGQLSDAEAQSLKALHPGLARWTPHYSAVWSRDGVIRHVCLSTDGGSIVWPYDLFIFDQDGCIVEADILEGPSGGWPKNLVNVAPLEIGFTGGILDKNTVSVRSPHSPEEARRTVIQRAEESQRMSLAFDEWRRSGSTNMDVLMQMVSAARTNSIKR